MTTASLPAAGAWQAWRLDASATARKLLANPLTAIGVAVIAVLVAVALFAPWIATHDPLRQDLAAALQPPGAALGQVLERVRAAFDPDRRLNPGRMD